MPGALHWSGIFTPIISFSFFPPLTWGILSLTVWEDLGKFSCSLANAVEAELMQVDANLVLTLSHWCNLERLLLLSSAFIVCVFIFFF